MKLPYPILVQVWKQTGWHLGDFHQTTVNPSLICLAFPHTHPPPVSPFLRNSIFPSFLSNLLHFLFSSNSLTVNHFFQLSPPSFSASLLSSCIVDLEASQSFLSAVGIMTISWVAGLFIFVPNEVRFLSAIATVSMDTLHLDTRSCFKCLIMGCAFPREW